MRTRFAVRTLCGGDQLPSSAGLFLGLPLEPAHKKVEGSISPGWVSRKGDKEMSANETCDGICGADSAQGSIWEIDVWRLSREYSPSVRQRHAREGF